MKDKHLLGENQTCLYTFKETRKTRREEAEEVSNSGVTNGLQNRRTYEDKVDYYNSSGYVRVI